MKTAFIIGYVWPEPASSAAGSRMLQLIRSLQDADYRVVYGSPAQSSPHALDLNGIDVQALTLTLNCSSFDELMAQMQPELVIFDRFMMEEQFGWRVEKHCPQAIRVLDTEDLHCLRHARHQALKHDTELTAKQIYSELAIREIAAILRCDLSLIISEYEMAWLEKWFQLPAGILHYCPFMADAEQQKPVIPFAQRQHFISIGNFRHAPNWDAVQYLKSDIWPQIRKSLPQVELHIYGAYPPPKATQLHNPKQGFVVKGWAEDALEVISQSRVMLAPLRFGAGLKGKLIDAASTGTPAVTSSTGAEGIYGDCDSGLLIADNADTFVHQAIALYQQPQMWQPLSHNASALIAKRFNGTEHSANLIRRIQQLSANLQQHRLDNFYGAMLRHHSMKSTQYMAQWIEAKNRFC
ncbi:glycosyltransferase [Lacimicrobium alkaliphilum]|uniref:Glycosyltransferase n=2 Tax=Lacimicrobium alkaliphilum TaxID=1526571 RepID=A0A0U3AD21_9ALTE|nr:glycosyltransferase [Lacimicrobium alkaliphilum]ALS98942.1 glycosyltransferase [Lacimicrobium alkaliphilum]